ncbi:MAG: tail fiber domain-containing protein [Actinobacteria bacterium]|nr:tail fiber domain-containing protein [Actinomycetota bacterium]
MPTPLNPVGNGANGQINVSWTPPAGSNASGYIVMSNYGTPGATGPTGPTGPSGVIGDLSNNKAVYQVNSNLASAQTLTIDSSNVVTIGNYVDYKNTYYDLYVNDLLTSFENNSINSINATWTQTGNSAFTFNNSIGAHAGYIAETLAKCSSNSPINCKISVIVAPGFTPYTNSVVSRTEIRIYNTNSDKYYQLKYETSANNIPVFTTTLYIQDYSGNNLITPESATSNYGPRLVEIYRSENTISFYVAGTLKYNGAISNVGTDIGLYGRSIYANENRSIYFKSFSIKSLLTAPQKLALMSGGDLLPNINSTYNIGSNTFPFNEIYTNNINILDIQNLTESNFLTYNKVTGRIGYDSIGNNSQVIYNNNGALDGTDIITISNDVLTVGPSISNETTFTNAYFSSLTTANKIDNPNQYNNSLIPTIEYSIPSPSANWSYTDDKGIVINNFTADLAFGINYSGNFDNEIQINQKNGNSQNATNSISYRIYVNYSVAGRNYYEFKYSYYNDSWTPLVTRQITSPANQIIHTSYIEKNFVGENYNIRIQRLRTNFSIIENNVKIFNKTEVDLKNQFSIYISRPGTYGVPFYLSNLCIKHISGFPLTSNLVLGCDIVPNLDNDLYIGHSNFSYKNIYVNNVNPANNQLTVFGDINTNGDVNATGFITSSDARVKSNISSLDTSSSLAIINNLLPRTFTLHTPQSDISNVPGFIADEVAAVYPKAITTGSKYIANIKQNFDCVLQSSLVKHNSTLYVYTVDISTLTELSYPSELSIRAGNKVLYIHVTVPVFSFTSEEAGLQQVYIMGTKVDDFKQLSYDYIYTLNIGATQELYKLIGDLQRRIAILENS